MIQFIVNLRNIKGQDKKIVFVVVALVVVLVLLFAVVGLRGRGGKGGNNGNNGGNGGAYTGECGIVDYGDVSGCSRTRLEEIPSLGLHSAGTDFDRTSPTGASYHRVIINWYQAEKEGSSEPSYEYLDNVFNDAQRNNMGVILSLRSNHPTKSTVEFSSTGGRNYDIPDSLPKSEDEWKTYVSAIVKRYKDKGLVGVQYGNERGQFKSDMKKTDPSYDKVNQQEYVKALKWTYEAVKSADPNMPVISTGLPGVELAVLADGFNERGWIYKGNDNSGIRKVTEADTAGKNSEGSTVVSVIVDGAPYYDYLDLHTRNDFPEDYIYAANWARSLWKKNNIQGKGLIALEFAGPFAVWSQEWQEYMFTAAPVMAYYGGFDAVTWAPWYKESEWADNFGRPSLIDENNKLRQPQYNIFSDMSHETKNFVKVQRTGEYEYTFTLADGSKNVIDVTPKVSAPTL